MDVRKDRADVVRLAVGRVAGRPRHLADQGAHAHQAVPGRAFSPPEALAVIRRGHSLGPGWWSSTFLRHRHNLRLRAGVAGALGRTEELAAADALYLPLIPSRRTSRYRKQSIT